MAEEELEKPAEGAEGEAGAEGAEPSKKDKKKIIIIAAAAGVLIALIVGGLFFAGVIPGGHKEGPSEEEIKNLTTPTEVNYYDLEEFLVNLNNPGKQVSFLKMVVTLELPSPAARDLATQRMPRIRDSFLVYLRELRSSDLQGSAGIQRLKEELLVRLNKVMEPERVNDILFKEIIVQ